VNGKGYAQGITNERGELVGIDFELKRLKHVWYNMKRRCEDPKDRTYRYYGKRGIQVCERWKKSFDRWLEDMGVPPTKEHEIDRINNDGNYEPGNCRWATRQQQIDNRRTFFSVHAYGVEEAIRLFLEADRKWKAQHPQEPA